MHITPKPVSHAPRTTSQPRNLATSLVGKLVPRSILKGALVALFVFVGACGTQAQSVYWDNQTSCDYLLVVMWGDASRCDPEDYIWSCDGFCSESFAIHANATLTEYQFICSGSADVCWIQVFDITGTTLYGSLKCNEPDVRGAVIPCGAGSFTLDMGKWGVWIY